MSPQKTILSRHWFCWAALFFCLTFSARATIANLGLKATANPQNLFNTASVSYLVSVTNYGPDIVTNPVVTVSYPAAMVFTKVLIPQGSYNTNSNPAVFNLGTLFPGDVIGIVIEATPVATGTLTLSASATSEATDTVTGNNSSSVAISSVASQANVGVNITTLPATPLAFSLITNTILVTNYGPDSLPNVFATNSFPTNVQVTSVTMSQGTFSLTNGKVLFAVGSLDPNTSATITVLAMPTTNGLLTNFATVGSYATDSVLSNNTNFSVVNVQPISANLAVGMTANPINLTVGDVVTYTVLVTNSGPNNAPNVTASNFFPSSLQVSNVVMSQGSADTNGATLVLNFGGLALNGTASAIIQGIATQPGPLSHSVTIWSPAKDTLSANNSSSTLVNVMAQTSDIGVLLTATPNLLSPLDPVTYTLIATNYGPYPAANVNVTFAFPSGFTAGSISLSQGTSSDITASPIIVSFGTMEANATATATIQGAYTGSGTQTASAQATTDSEDDNQANNFTQTDVTLQDRTTDLGIGMTGSPASLFNRDTLTYTLSVTNFGTNAVAAATVTDNLPPGFQISSVTTSQGTTDASGGPLIWSIGAMNIGDVVTATITGIPTQAGAVVNTATVSSEFVDVVQFNDTASVSTDVQAPNADLAMRVTATPTGLFASNTVTFTLRVTNFGPDRVDFVQVTDPLPPGLTVSSVTMSTGTFATSNSVEVFSIGTLNSNQSATITFRTVPTQFGTMTNTFTASSEGTDANPIDNVTNVLTQVFNPNAANTSIAMSLSTNATPVGSTVTYTIVVTNRGPAAATNVIVSDILTNGLSGGASTVSQGTASFDGSAYFFALGRINSNRTATITFQASVTNAGPIVNRATVSSEKEDDFPDDNLALVGLAVTLPTSSDFSVGASVSTNITTTGSTLFYAVTVTNLGYANATNVIVTDLLPNRSLLSFVTMSQGTYYTNGNAIIFNLGGMAVNGRATINFQAVPTMGGLFTNVTTVSSEWPDPNVANNTVLLPIGVNPTDLSLSLTSSVTNVVGGASMSFDVAVTNNGPGPATSVTLTDTMPVNWTLFDATQTQGTFSNGFNVAVFNFGILPVGAVARAHIVAMSSTDLGTVTNLIAVTENELDLNPGDNLGTNTLVVLPQPAMIAQVAVNPQGASAFVTWVTFSNATAQVAYGTNSAFGSQSHLNANLTTNHIVWLTGLQTNTVYNYRITSVSGGVTYTYDGTFATAGSALIVDDLSATFAGVWTLSSSATNKYGPTYQFTASDATHTTAGAEFRPNLPASGNYDVSVWCPLTANASTNVFIQISGVNNQFTTVDESVSQGQWHLIKSAVPFAAGTNGFVTIYNYTGETNKQIVADAMRWVYNVGVEKPADGTVPDWWAQQYFGTNVSGTADSDGDGYSNYQEFVLGTNPNDASDKLNFQVTPLTTNQVTVTVSPWQAGRNYQLQRALKLTSPNWVTLTNIPVINGDGNAIYTVTNPPATNGFYRVITTLAP